MRISKEGDEYLRTLLVQEAHYILGPFGEDSDLRRWGQKLAALGGKNAKKRAVVAVGRKLAVLLHRLWVSEIVDYVLQATVRHLSLMNAPKEATIWLGCGHCTVRMTVPEAVIVPEVPVTAMV